MPQNQPDGFHTVTPQIISSDARKTLEFVEAVFDAKTLRVYEDGELIVHSEVMVGDSRIMVAQADDEFGDFPAMLNVYVDEVDATFAKAVEHGASPLRAPEDQFYGDRIGGVVDSEGNQWWIATHLEDVPEEEVRRRIAELAG
jgi:PhnB protein